MHREIWDKISPAGQAKILSISKGLFVGMVKKRRTANDHSIDVLKKNGISVVLYDMESEAMKFVLAASAKARETMVPVVFQGAVGPDPGPSC